MGRRKKEKKTQQKYRITIGNRLNQSFRSLKGFPAGSVGKESACKRRRFHPWVRKIPLKRKRQPTQYPCLENSMDKGAWWATVHGVTKSQTRQSD